MPERSRLENRREAETLDFFVMQPSGARQFFIATVGRFPDGRPAELFINTSMRHGSDADTNAHDGAVAISLALQYGCPIDTLREAMKRNANGTATGVLGAALDAIRALDPPPEGPQPIPMTMTTQSDK